MIDRAWTDRQVWPMSASAPLTDRVRQAHSLAANGDWRAVSVLIPVKEAERSANADALTLAGVAAREQGDTETAIRLLKSVEQVASFQPLAVNALGLALAAAGKADKALAAFQRVIDRQPAMLDAHINRALVANEAGRHDDALRFVDASLTHIPGHARLLSLRGVINRARDDCRAAISDFAASIHADPQRALTRHHLAATLKYVGQDRAACDQFAAAAQLGMRTPDVAANWAAAAMDSGQTDLARDLLHQAIRIAPERLDFHASLSRLEWEYGDAQNAFASYARAVDQNETRPELWLAWAQQLMAYKQYAQAKDVVARAKAHFPSVGEFPVIGAQAMALDGNPAASLTAFANSLQHHPEWVEPHLDWAAAALQCGDAALAQSLCEGVLAHQPHHQGAWAWLSTAWRVQDDPREFWLCDYDNLVVALDLEDVEQADPPSGGEQPPQDAMRASAARFALSVAPALNRLHVQSRAPGNQSLRHGTQTSGSLFARLDAEIQRIQSAVRAAVARHLATLTFDSHHPFFRRLSTDFRFAGSWSVRLVGSGGHHVAHYHSDGWISSACYLALPDTMGGSSGTDGFITFGAPPDNYGLGLEPRKIIEPLPGRLALFPSYVWHGTRAFSGDGVRLTAAFDIVPHVSA